MRQIFTDRKVFSWALYDWANSAFATTVLAAFFPAFFKDYWSAGAAVGTSTFQLGVGHSLASVLMVILAPVLGAIADAGAAKKRFLGGFALLGIAMTATLYLVAEGDWLFALGVFVLANLGFSAANAFYDSLIVGVARHDELDLVSAYGYALGYLGGGLLFAVNITMVVWPAMFGFSDAQEAVRVSFLCVAAWWFVFSIPLYLNVPEPGAKKDGSALDAIRAGFRQLANTFHEIRKLRVVLLFLVAYWLYIDGVHTIVRMAVDYGMALGFGMSHLFTALLITQFVAFPAAVGFGILAGRIGAKAGYSHRHRRVHAGHGLGDVYGSGWRVLCAGCGHRAGAGWCTVAQPVSVCAHHPGKQIRGVLRFLQCPGQVRRGTRTADGRFHQSGDGKSATVTVYHCYPVCHRRPVVVSG